MYGCRITGESIRPLWMIGHIRGKIRARYGRVYVHSNQCGAVTCLGIDRLLGSEFNTLCGTQHVALLVVLQREHQANPIHPSQPAKPLAPPSSWQTATVIDLSLSPAEEERLLLGAQAAVRKVYEHVSRKCMELKQSDQLRYLGSAPQRWYSLCASKILCSIVSISLQLTFCLVCSWYLFVTCGIGASDLGSVLLRCAG